MADNTDRTFMEKWSRAKLQREKIKERKAYLEGLRDSLNLDARLMEENSSESSLLDNPYYLHVRLPEHRLALRMFTPFKLNPYRSVLGYEFTESLLRSAKNFRIMSKRYGFSKLE